MFSKRRHIATHTIVYISIVTMLTAVWISREITFYDGWAAGIILFWTPVYLLCLVRHLLQETEYRHYILLTGSSDKTTVTSSSIVEQNVLVKQKREQVHNNRSLDCDEVYRLELNGFTLCPDLRRLQTPQNGIIRLTRTECRLLNLLMRHESEPLSVSVISQTVWGYEDNDATALKNAVYRLRKKLEPDPQTPVYLVTIPDKGYVFYSDS